MADEPLADRNHRFTGSALVRAITRLFLLSRNEDRAKSWSATAGERRCIPRRPIWDKDACTIRA